jgi:catechol 2,3-dioxygenase
MGDIDYLYFREPSGMRIELNSGTLRNYEPDCKPVRWTDAQGSNIFYRNVEFPHSMFESFPAADAPVPEQAPAFT